MIVEKTVSSDKVKIVRKIAKTIRVYMIDNRF